MPIKSTSSWQAWIAVYTAIRWCRANRFFYAKDMAKSRYINTKFWSDSFIVELNPLDKYLFLYLLTNEHTDICGIYELSFKVMARETGLDNEMLEKMFQRLDKKVYYVDNWVFIKNFIKNQLNNPSVEKGIKRSLKKIPTHVLAKFRKIDTGLDSLCTDCHIPNLNLNLNSNLTLTKPNGTVAKATSLHFNNETYMIEELKYEPINNDGTIRKKPFSGKKSMFRIAWHYLKMAGLEKEAKVGYDIAKISKGISKLLKQFGSEEKVIEAITKAGDYFNSQGLSWTPEAVWRDYELIDKWIDNSKSDEVKEIDKVNKFKQKHGLE